LCPGRPWPIAHLSSHRPTPRNVCRARLPLTPAIHCERNIPISSIGNQASFTVEYNDLRAPVSCLIERRSDLLCDVLPQAPS
jgi:hypothetical protein